MHGGDDQTMGKLMFLYVVIQSLLCRYDRISGRIQVRQLQQCQEADHHVRGLPF